jgi:uncharacterized protein (TIGR02217 family)
MGLSAIPDYRLPVALERGAQFAAAFSTDVLTALTGREQRVRNWATCRGKGDVGYALRQITDVSDQINYIKQVVAIHMAHHGKERPFRFRDPSDYTTTTERFGTGDGSTTTFQLTKSYDPSQLILSTAGPYSYVRDILLPVASGIQIFNNAVIVSGSDYTLTALGGTVAFNTAPANGHALTWTGSFDLPVRFDTDVLALKLNSLRHAQIGSIPIIEVIGAQEVTGD